MSAADPGAGAVEFRSAGRGLPRGWRTLSVYLLVIGVVIFAGIFADVVSPHHPDKQDIVNRLQGPIWQTGDWNHVFGTDALGRDQFSRVIHGARISVTVVAIVIPVAVLLGTLLGLVAGWRLGLVDRGIMRVVDVQLAFPAILFAVLLAAITGPSLRNVIIILAIFLWAPFARLVRRKRSPCASATTSSPPEPSAPPRIASSAATCCPTSSTRSSSWRRCSWPR